MRELTMEEIEEVSGGLTEHQAWGFGSSIAGIIGGAVGVGMAFSAGGPVGFAVGFGLGMAGVFGGSAGLALELSNFHKH